MMRRLLATLAALAFMCSASAEQIPRYAISLAKYSSAVPVSDDATRLRISVATDSTQGERSVRVGDVLLCHASACFRAHTTGYVDIFNTATGTATVIADVVIPAVPLTDVYFVEPGGHSAVRGHLQLRAPLVIQKGFHGLELLIGVRKQATAGKSSYVPFQWGSSYFNSESQLVHYLPSIRTSAKLALGTVLTIPAGALDKPQVFHVSVHDRGDLYPSLDIYPYLKLNKPAIVEVQAIPGGASTREMIVPAYSPEEKHLYVPLSGPLPKNARISLSQTGAVEPSAFEDAGIEPVRTTPNDNAATTKSCAEILAQPVVLGTIHMASLKGGAVRVKTCENKPPYIHILYVNTLHKNIHFSIPYKPSGIVGGGPNLMLQRIPDFAVKSFGLINGFMWDGDSGTAPGQSGKVLGIVRSGGVKLGDNVLAGGIFCKGCSIADPKFAMIFTRDKTRPVFLTTAASADIPDFAMNIVSSSTSVIKDGNCATPGGTNRWSAVGASYGRMILISSTSRGETSAAELCAVFRSFAIRNALRLDGGPSAAMVVSGKLLNELQGLATIKYGYLRHIAYPLRISSR